MVIVDAEAGVTDDSANPANITSREQLAKAIMALRRLNARPGQVQQSVRDIAEVVGRPVSTVHGYLRGTRLIPRDDYETLLRRLGVTDRQLRPWLDAWDRVADQGTGRTRPPDKDHEARPTGVTTDLFRVAVPRRKGRIGIVAADIRRVRDADIWVNSENTEMTMARFEEDSISAIIRYGGAVRDAFGRVIDDVIASELERKVAGRRPVAPGTAVVTGSGALALTNRVRHVIHVASVRGEPGEGYRPIAGIGLCVANAMQAAQALDPPGSSILFPLLGTGVAGADLPAVIAEMTSAAIDHLTTRPGIGPQVVYLLASTLREQRACLAALTSHPLLAPVGTRRPVARAERRDAS